LGVTTEINPLDDSQSAATIPESDPESGRDGGLETVQEEPATLTDTATEPEAETETGAETGGEPGSVTVDAVVLAGIAASVTEIAGQSERYHARAEQREGVIDFLRTELDTLRQGERRGLLRPLLSDLCRLRGDLLSQAETLPPDYDAAKAAELLRSYADTITDTLESNGVVTYAPDGGDRFDPRLHRRVGGEAAPEPELAGHIAAVRQDGYLDIEAGTPVRPAEVIVYAAQKAPLAEPAKAAPLAEPAGAAPLAEPAKATPLAEPAAGGES
jgi:molecular chaperone GrpE